MEIQRKIVESKFPPSNKEVWWFDTNTEVLKRYTRGAWVQVIDSAELEYDDSGTIMETTYDEAKALYESGKMIPGVKYAFEYKHNVLAYTDNENNVSSAILIISIKTGSAILYIGITAICIAIIGLGVYFIKKRVLNRGI